MAQDTGIKRARIDIENYVIDADINPHTQSLSANVKVQLPAVGQRHFVGYLLS